MNIAIGHKSGVSTTGVNNIFIGSSSGATMATTIIKRRHRKKKYKKLFGDKPTIR